MAFTNFGLIHGLPDFVTDRFRSLKTSGALADDSGQT
jgi:hypothetical protein